MKHPVIDEWKIRGVSEILRSGQLSGFKGSPVGMSGGFYVQQLEKNFEEYLNVKHAIAVQSGTAGLHTSLLALGIGQGDEVIVSPYTFSSSASCVLMVGAKPVFADIRDDTFCINPTEIFKAITPRTKAIIPVDLMGHPADMYSIKEIAEYKHLKVIEDAAQAIGASYDGHKTGTLGDIGVFSFNQSKQISTGEGGLVVTNNDELAHKLRALRNHAEVSAPELKMVGFNYRLCEIEAYLALKQLEGLDSMLEIRRNLTLIMSKGLSQFKGFTPPVILPNCTHSFYTYGVKFNKVSMSREGFQAEMLKRGVYFGSGYVTPLYLYPIYWQFGYKEGLCPVTERMWKKELMVFDWLRYPMVEQEVYGIIDIVGEIVNGRN